MCVWKVSFAVFAYLHLLALFGCISIHTCIGLLVPCIADNWVCERLQRLLSQEIHPISRIHPRGSSDSKPGLEPMKLQCLHSKLWMSWKLHTVDASPPLLISCLNLFGMRIYPPENLNHLDSWSASSRTLFFRKLFHMRHSTKKVRSLRIWQVEHLEFQNTPGGPEEMVKRKALYSYSKVWSPYSSLPWCWHVLYNTTTTQNRCGIACTAQIPITCARWDGIEWVLEGGWGRVGEQKGSCCGKERCMEQPQFFRTANSDVATARSLGAFT